MDSEGLTSSPPLLRPREPRCVVIEKAAVNINEKERMQKTRQYTAGEKKGEAKVTHAHVLLSQQFA